MFKILLFLFIFVPLLEIYLLIKVGTQIGAISTLLLIVFTAILGAFLLRLQGFLTLSRIREAIDKGELPAVTLVEGLILLIAGVMLLTPGFFTDMAGFLCLVPVIREQIARHLLQKYFTFKINEIQKKSVIIEGEFRDETENQSYHERRLDRQ